MGSCVKALTLASVNSNTFDGTYKVINSSGLSEACFLVRIVNDCDKDITISYDGTTDNDYLRTGETLQISFDSQSTDSNSTIRLKQNTKIYAKAAVGTGLVYLSGYYF